LTRDADGAGLAARASAKVNLTLEIKGKRSDGYHELESLVMFADLGDNVSIRAAPSYSLSVDGPFAGALDGVNLIERAVVAFAEAYRVEAKIDCRLTKALPVAAGLGGGSSDAAAVLRLLREMFGKPADIDDLAPLARALGADVPCCLYGRAAIMRGLGERLTPLKHFPAAIPALLVNPMRPLATSEVFRRLNALPLVATNEAEAPALTTADEVIAYAIDRANDLEPTAISLLPVVADVLATLRGLPGARLARLSGSGPTCFALFTTRQDAESAAQAVTRERPGWWVRAAVLS
jgi:4-diphosphocytidyl-2-C-methyl-D-erythritol kinase